jgi:hypothetical protein
MSGSTRARVRRARRRLLLGSGPLKRGSDRVQMAGRLLVVLSLLAAVPLAVLAAGLTRARLDAVAAAQAAERHEVRAVVLTSTAAAPTTGAGPASVVRAEVGWRGPGDTGRHAELLVPAGTAAGTTVPLWVDRAGNPTTAPLDRTGIGDSSLAVGVAATAAVPLVGWGLYGGLCVVLEAHRRRRWGRDWARVEREWRARLG